MNTSKSEKIISFNKFEERTKGFSKYKNVINNNMGSMTDFKLGSYHTIVLELVK
jgi:hypothetical protein